MAGEPVTVVVRRHVRPGRETEYEAWLSRLTEGVARQFPGYLGAEFHRPAGQGEPYSSVFRFDGLDTLDAFETSDFRARMLEEGAPLFAGDAVWERMTGLEFWFDPPAGTRVPQPSPHRMALVLVAVVYVLVLAINAGLGRATSGWSPSLRLLLFVCLQVGLMTYLIMPRLTPRIARFIFPRSKRD
ncbi:antibiotic biosynthesis monooxygenase [Rhodobacterales bacterium HKCCE3408]|nr:antibiotic biosynthesis monooxygenase [Rhodobacterales bacterium HKCCE3408]